MATLISLNTINFLSFFYPILTKFASKCMLCQNLSSLIHSWPTLHLPFKVDILISRHWIMAGYYGLMLVIHVPVCLSHVHPCFRFRTITWIHISLLFFFNQTCYMHWYCASLVWDSQWANFVMFWHIKLPSHHIFVYSFSDNNVSKYQWIFTKLGICIDIVEIWFGIANGQISLIFQTELSVNNLKKYRRMIFTKLVMFID